MACLLFIRVALVTISLIGPCLCGSIPAGFELDNTTNTLMTTQAFVVLASLNTSMSVRVRATHVLLLGDKDARVDSSIGGNLTLESESALFIEAVQLHLGGALFRIESGSNDQCTLITLSEGATISGDQSNGTLCLDANNVSTCVLVETDNATVDSYNGLVPMMTNISCINSFFGQVNLSAGTAGSGSGSGSFVWPDASSCTSSSMIAVAVTVTCLPESNTNNGPVSTGAIPNAGLPIFVIAPDGSVIISNGTPNGDILNQQQQHSLEPWIVAAIISCACIVFILMVTVAVVVAVMKCPALRKKLMPFRDREHYYSSSSLSPNASNPRLHVNTLPQSKPRATNALDVPESTPRVDNRPQWRLAQQGMEQGCEFNTL